MIKGTRIIIPIIMILGAITLFSANNELSELSKLKAENFKLRTQLLQCSIKMQDASLSTEQQNLINQFRQELGVDEKAIFDWNTLKFNSPPSNPK